MENIFRDKSVAGIINIPLILMGKKDIDKNCNLEKMFNIAESQMIMNSFLLIYDCVMDRDFRKKCITAENENESKLNKIYQILNIIDNQFKKQGVKYWLIKGLALAQYTDCGDYKRDFNDLDIVVEKSQLNKAVDIMINLGFEHNFDKQIVNKIESLECYELGFFYPFIEGGSLSKVMNNKISVELKIGTSSIKDENFIKRLLSNSECKKINDLEINILNINDMFILLCTNIYCNIELEFAKLKIRDLFDFYYFFYNNNNKLDYKYIFDTCKNYRISHQIYCVLSLFSSIYDDLVPDEVTKKFHNDMKEYDMRIYHKYENGSLRDWNIDIIDLMLDRDARTSEMYFEHAVKTYTSRNNKFNSKIYINSLKDTGNAFDDNPMLPGFKSAANELEYSYRFNHDDTKIYFTLHFDKYRHENNMRTVLILFDIDRVFPRKMIEFSFNNQRLVCKSLYDDMSIEEVRATDNEITCSIEKKYFNVLLNKGRVLGYRIYSVRNFDGTDFAIKDDNKNFDVQNCNLLYLYTGTDKLNR